MLDLAANRSADNRRLFVKAVNTSRDRALRTTVTVSGAAVDAGGSLQTLTVDSLAAANSFRTPEAVTIRTASFRSGARFTVDLPPHSVTVLTLPLTGS